MEYQEILQNARTCMGPYCKACPVCNGQACKMCIRDRDIEVHGVTPQQLEAVLDRMGDRRTVGASFGVYGLAGCGLDIAMPRREAAVGRGHRDFTVEVDPWLGPERAARRRDFTVNALMEDVLTGQVLDLSLIHI